MQFTLNQWYNFDDFTENKIREEFDYHQQLDGYTLVKGRYSIRVYEHTIPSIGTVEDWKIIRHRIHGWRK